MLASKPKLLCGVVLWPGGREGGAVGNNHVTANRLESVMSDYCCDGGGIYTLGPQPGSTVSRNHILQPFRDDWPYPRQPCVTNKSKHTPTNPPGGLGNYSGCGGKGIYHGERRATHVLWLFAALVGLVALIMANFGDEFARRQRERRLERHRERHRRLMEPFHHCQRTLGR